MTSYSSSTVTMSFSSIISELQQLTVKKICIFLQFLATQVSFERTNVPL